MLSLRRVNWEEEIAGKSAKITALSGDGDDSIDNSNGTFLVSTTVPSIINSTIAEPINLSTAEPSQSDTTHKREEYMIVYTVIIVVGTLVYVFRSFSFFNMCLRVSINMHDMLFRGITRARMIFFNNNPSGRILNRFARDISNVDSLLPVVMLDVIDVSSTFHLLKDIRHWRY